MVGLLVVVFAVVSCARTLLRLPPADASVDGGQSDAGDGGVGFDAGDAGSGGKFEAWGAPFRISDGDAGFASSVAVSRYAWASSDVIWSTSSGASVSLWGARVDTDGGVSFLQRLAEFDGGVIINPRVSSAPNFTVSAATFLYASTLDAGSPRELWAARRDGSWFPTALLSNSGSVTFPSLAQVGAETFLATWMSYSDYGSMRIARSDGASPVWIDAGSLDGGNPILRGASMGENYMPNTENSGPIVTALNNCIMQMGQMSCQVTVQWTAGDTWQTPYRADTLGGEIWASPFVGAANGQATVAWLKAGLDFFSGELWAARCNTGGCSSQQMIKSFPYVNPEFMSGDGPTGIDVKQNVGTASLIVWAERDAGVFMSHSSGFGTAWTSPMKIADKPADKPVANPISGDLFGAAWREGTNIVVTWITSGTTAANLAPISVFGGASTITDLKISAGEKPVLLVWVADGVVWGVWAQ